MFGSNYVAPEGPHDARIVVLGEAPGAHEDKEGRPFCGASGRELSKLLDMVGISRQSCYLTNVVKYRPPDNNFGLLYQDKSRRKPTEELLRARQELVDELKEISPNVIIALGNEALRAVTDKDGISKWRGSVVRSKTTGCKVLTTYHPAYMFRDYSVRPQILLDLKKAQSESLNPKLEQPTEHFCINPTFDQVLSWLDRMLIDKPQIAVDIETCGKRIRCIGIAKSKSTAICIPFISTNIGLTPTDAAGSALLVPGGPSSDGRSRWTPEEEFKILQRLDQVLSDHKIKKFYQNFPFDGTLLLEEFGLHTRGFLCDTLVGFHTLYSEMPKSLDFLTSVYTNRPRYSDYESASDDSTWIYNCRDCVVTWEVAQNIMAELKEAGLWDFYEYLVHPTLLALTRMGNAGIPVNNEARERLKADYRLKLDKIQQKLSDVVGEDFNPRSSKQKQELLYDHLGLPKQYNRKTGNPTTDKRSLQKLLERHPQHSNVLQSLLDFSGLDKLITGFLSKPLPFDGFMRTSFNAHGTVNGRISSSETIWGEGGNMQNNPRGPFRRMFEARPPEGSNEEYLWIKADLSQAEARCVAWEANIEKLIEEWARDVNWDIHKWNAAENIFHVDIKDVTKDQRFVSKAGVHGGNYGLGPDTAALLFGISVENARKAIYGYRKALPKVTQWWGAIERQLYLNCTLRNPFGRRRVFLDRLEDHKTIRSGYSFGPQSTIGDHINKCLVLCMQILPTIGWRPVLQVHDELDFIGPKKTADQAIRVIFNVLEGPIVYPDIDEILYIPAELGIGPNWYDIEDVPRPEDL